MTTDFVTFGGEAILVANSTLGPTGPTGPTAPGPTGPTGPTGPVGPTGPGGTSGAIAVSGSGFLHATGGTVDGAASHGASGQLPFGGTADITWSAPSGDIALSVATIGKFQVNGLEGQALPGLTTGNLGWNGLAWAFSPSFTPADDLSGNGTSTASDQYVSSLSFSNTGATGAGGNIAVKGTTTALDWRNNAATLKRGGTTVLSLGLNSADFIALGATPAAFGAVRLGAAASTIIVAGANPLLTVDSGGNPTCTGATTVTLQAGGENAIVVGATMTLVENDLSLLGGLRGFAAFDVPFHFASNTTGASVSNIGLAPGVSHTLTPTEYCVPCQVLTGTLGTTGTALLIFPNQVGAAWLCDCTNLTMGGESPQVICQVAGSGASAAIGAPGLAYIGRSSFLAWIPSNELVSIL